MADTTITALPAASAVATTDVLPMDISAASATQKVTTQQIVNAGLTSPGPIGSTSANTGKFTGLTATGTTTLATSLTGVLKSTSGVVSTATSGTDYAPATSGSNILYGNGSGGFSAVTVGSGLSFSTGTLSATNAGTVTAVSVATANGLAGTSSGGSTPALTLSTTITGVLKGNGTAISAATAGTDYTTPTGTESLTNKTINSSTIGATTPLAGTFTQLAYVNDAPGITTTATAAGTTTLTNTATFYQRFTGSTTQTVKLPDETTISAGVAYVIDNDSTGNITLQDSAGGALGIVTPGMAGYIYSTSNASATGNWVGYAYVPGTGPTSQILWGTAGLDLGGGYVKSGAFQMASGAIVTEATASRTLSASDNGKVIYCTNSSAVTITTASGLGAAFSCTIIQGGAGQITLAQGSSTTLVSYGSLVKSAGQYAMMSIINPVADTFYLGGNLGA